MRRNGRDGREVNSVEEENLLSSDTLGCVPRSIPQLTVKVI
jgi:hypothetical protein